MPQSPPPSRRAVRRVAILSSVLALVALVTVAALWVTSKNADDASPPDQASSTVSVDQPSASSSSLAPPSSVAHDAVATEALATLSPAIDGLLGEPMLTITARSDIDGQIQTFEIDYDATLQSYRSIETLGEGGIADTTVERIATADTVYLRVADPTPGAESFWNVIPVDSGVPLNLEQIYTLFGRISPALEDLPAMWRSLPMTAEHITADGLEGYRLTLNTYDVAIYLQTLGTIVSGHAEDTDETIFEVLLDGGELRRLSARGVQFFSGEALDTPGIDITYRPAPVEIVAPQL